MKVKDIMNKEVVAVSADTAVSEVAGILVEKKIHGVPVVDEEPPLGHRERPHDAVQGGPQTGLEVLGGRQDLAQVLQGGDVEHQLPQEHVARASCRHDTPPGSRISNLGSGISDFGSRISDLAPRISNLDL